MAQSPMCVQQQGEVDSDGIQSDVHLERSEGWTGHGHWAISRLG